MHNTGDMKMRESMMSHTRYFFCILLYEIQNISFFADLTIRKLFIESCIHVGAAMAITHVQGKIKPYLTL